MADTQVSTAAVQVYNPASSGSPHAALVNVGPATAYLGQAQVNASTGLPLPPNQRVDLTQAASALYAICGAITGAPSGTSSAAVAAGATSITVASGGTSYTSGMQLVLDTGALQEIVTVTSGATGTNIPLSTATRFAHASGVAFAAITQSQRTTVRVVSGAT